MSSAVHCYSYPAPALNRNPVIEAWVQEVVDADFSPSRPYQPQPFLDAITRPFLRKRRRSIENKDGDNVSNPRNLSIIKKRRLCDRTPLAPMDANTDAGGAPPQTPRAVANPKATMKATKQPPDIIMRDSGAMDVESEDELGNADYTSPTPRGARYQHRHSQPQPLPVSDQPSPLFTSLYSTSLDQRGIQETSRINTHHHPPPLFPLPSKSASASETSASSSRRSRSPTKGIKGMADLLFAEKRVQIVPKLPDHDIPQDVTELCERLVDISDGCGVVPASIATEVHSRVRQINPSHKLRPHHLTSPNDDATNSSPQTLESLMGELWVLSKVARETIAANVYTYSEAHWNARIHAPLLEAGIEIDVNQDGTIQQDVRYIDATRAGISSLYVPRHTDGDSLAGKMVDYCIVLNDPHVQEAARAALLAAQAQEAPLSSAASSSASSATSRGSRRGAGGANARSMASASVAETAAAARSINHTGYPPLRLSPIAVSIETKQPEGSDDEAKAQLSVWVASHFLRLHKLARSPAPIGLTLPLLHVSGRVWHVYLAVERADGIDLFEWVAVEGTETLIGCYKVLSLLRALRSWALKSFRPRFLNLLGSSVAP
ncbi:hypothetical protein CLIM01_14914 [Colletotrichum limetticola]|uniref:PD-(D/E)XK nuclease-like domain-containing protein n=1 Tax=Colletotrichum limetticola TaxID=1209924 RepID=A0ABQ9P768_9PEZI|nr:hypothetical protein CLIM01_14914 [Colletotrichum limetticola]